MGVLSEEMKRVVAEVRLGYVATVSRDGTPNLSPKGSLKVWDDDHLVFADIASPGTVENLRSNPWMEVNVVDPFRRRGFRFKGRAESLTDATLLAFVEKDLGHSYPVRCVVKLHVESAAPLLSPVYTYTSLSEEQVREVWLQRYGYEPRAIRRRSGTRDMG